MWKDLTVAKADLWVRSGVDCLIFILDEEVAINSVADLVGEIEEADGHVVTTFWRRLWDSGDLLSGRKE